MYRSIIVDDEPLMREGLRTLIDWTSLGFSLAGEAMDARGALVLALEVRPHLAILDIRLPGMDGTMLARKLKEALPDLIIIFFSGYKDFQYAHEAIRLQAFRYLLKPLEPQALEQVLREALFVLDSLKENDMLATSLRAFAHGQHDDSFLRKLRALMGVSEGDLLHALVVSKHMAPPTDNKIHAFHYDEGITILLWSASLPQLPAMLDSWLGDAPHQHAMAESLAALGTGIQAMLAHRGPQDAGTASRDEIVEWLHAYIAGHYSANPSLRDFAQTIGFHKGYLGQLIKQETGLSFHAHVANIRFERARYLLRQTDEPVRAIAEAVGIHDVDYFTAQFKRRTGKTPTQFRKRSEGPA